MYSSIRYWLQTKEIKKTKAMELTKSTNLDQYTSFYRIPTEQLEQFKDSDGNEVENRIQTMLYDAKLAGCKHLIIRLSWSDVLICVDESRVKKYENTQFEK